MVFNDKAYRIKLLEDNIELQKKQIKENDSYGIEINKLNKQIVLLKKELTESLNKIQELKNDIKYKDAQIFSMEKAKKE